MTSYDFVLGILKLEIDIAFHVSSVFDNDLPLAI